MDTPDTLDNVATKKTRGRPKKTDQATPLGSYIAEQAKENRSRKSGKIVKKFYEMQGTKLSLCKQIDDGTVFRILVGTTTDKVSGKQVDEFAKKLLAEGRLKVKL